MKNTDLLTHSEKNQQADRLCAEKSGYYGMNAVYYYYYYYYQTYFDTVTNQPYLS